VKPATCAGETALTQLPSPPERGERCGRSEEVRGNKKNRKSKSTIALGDQKSVKAKSEVKRGLRSRRRGEEEANRSAEKGLGVCRSDGKKERKVLVARSVTPYRERKNSGNKFWGGRNVSGKTPLKGIRKTKDAVGLLFQNLQRREGGVSWYEGK